MPGWTFSSTTLANNRASIANIPGPDAPTSLAARHVANEGDTTLFYPHTSSTISTPVKGIMTAHTMRRSANFLHEPSAEKVVYPGSFCLITVPVNGTSSGQYTYRMMSQTGPSGFGYSTVISSPNRNNFTQASPYVCQPEVWYKVIMQIEYGSRFAFPNITYQQALDSGLADTWNHIARLWISEWNGTSWGPLILTHEYTSRFVFQWEFDPRGPGVADDIGNQSENGEQWTVMKFDIFRGGDNGPTPPAPQFTYLNRTAVYYKPLP